MDDSSVEPTIMPLDLLLEITNGFSEDRKIGSGSFGKVYLGEHRDGKKIAVKKLHDMPGLDDKHFQNEFKNLTRLRHQNIVQLVGYCHDIQEEKVLYQGKWVVAERVHRAICLEYMSNGSLDKYLSDECDRYDWRTCYRIIKGICQGLKYLHNELKPPIYHLDLKPANILLDENMVPRIADFGTSRLFSDEQTRSTQSLLGTLGYSPPEFIRSNLISNKFDIFSLGVVIIKMMAGRAGHSQSTEMSSQEFTNLVQKNWTNRLLETLNLRSAYSEQEANRNTFPLHAQDLNDRHSEQNHGSTFNQDIVATTQSNYFEQNPGPRKARLDDDSQFYRNDNQYYLADGGPLPSIEGFKIVGDPRSGFTLRACGFLTNGTTRCNFQWVRYPVDGTRQPIQGATMDDYVVSVDDVGTILAVECTPMDDYEGDMMREFANIKNTITCGKL